jgi:hypothetical protein
MSLADRRLVARWRMKPQPIATPKAGFRPTCLQKDCCGYPSQEFHRDYIRPDHCCPPLLAIFAVGSMLKIAIAILPVLAVGAYLVARTLGLKSQRRAQYLPTGNPDQLMGCGVSAWCFSPGQSLRLRFIVSSIAAHRGKFQ